MHAHSSRPPRPPEPAVIVTPWGTEPQDTGRFRQDHRADRPRVWGEHLTAIADSHPDQGPSPRARGAWARGVTRIS
ncbi:hypothetical protein GCM10022630_16220 [Thermobifida alba]